MAFLSDLVEITTKQILMLGLFCLTAPFQKVVGVSPIKDYKTFNNNATRERHRIDDDIGPPVALCISENIKRSNGHNHRLNAFYDFKRR